VNPGRHLRHHARFYLTGLLGVLVWFIVPDLNPAIRLTLAGDVFFATYLLATGIQIARATTDSMRRRAAYEDEGVLVIFLMAVAAVVVSELAIFDLIHNEDLPVRLRLILAVVTVLLAWLTMHTIAAVHYAHIYYAPASDPHDEDGDAGGLVFPGTPVPDFSDFLYYAFVIGMTAQVSDVQVSNRRMRRITLGHGVLSFLFNTVLLALAVNVAASQA
jgi:uncharacterized membrane protein